MKRSTQWLVAIVFLVIGFMVAVQFQTTSHEAQVRETRDVWEVREELKRQQEQQQELLDKIAIADQTIEDYDRSSSRDQLETLKESIESLENKIGLREKEGKGLEMTIRPIFEEEAIGQEYPKISPHLLSRLLNELNTYGAEDVSIGNERFTTLSPIRDVNGATYVNNRPIGSLPMSIKVLANDAEKLQDYMEASPIQDIFNIDNMEIIFERKEQLVLPKFDEPLHLETLEEAGG
ncbi:DUF881 domain-containing protein [Halobacillus karajensis]|uniref:DUF881 domain-containing protein n=1 Tax=Halobacillus karajensis TaxID=195088 RepID=A0A024P3U3_9BACI|nr:DUF881 domain-containing protein [Halobacillus karajensis]CDQ19837.1 hypothetical protein BN982_02143 [Halobacillus karajensis]CDQ22297.1 hypothetical protein BN983_00504 [Halobacillus karajensis]CDQ28138.1 hypothetical protein BN981_02431 [Halobacillus karajensis]